MIVVGHLDTRPAVSKRWRSLTNHSESTTAVSSTDTESVDVAFVSFGIIP